MASLKIKLTKAAIDRFEAAPGKQTLIWDTEVRGFGVRVSPGGAKTYILQRRAGGQERRISLGRTDDVAPEGARKKALKLAAQFAEGIDPVRERKRAERGRLTLRQAFAEYICAPAKKGGGRGQAKKPRTVRDIERHRRYFADWLDHPVTEIKPSMIRGRHAELAERSPVQANIAMRYLRACLNHVIANGEDDDEPLLAVNPVNRLNRTNSWAAVRVRRRHLRDDQIGPWIHAVQSGLVGIKHERELRDALMFYLLTGARLTEVLGSDVDGYPPLGWDDVDLHRRTVTFSETKNRLHHELPLSAWLTGMLGERREIAGPEYVFSARDGSRPTDVRGALGRVEQLTGLRITPHDLRRTFGTVAEAVDVGKYTIKRLMNHASGGDVTADYLQISVERLREPMQRIEDHMLRLAGIRPDADAHVRAWREHLAAAVVVPIRRLNKAQAVGNA